MHACMAAACPFEAAEHGLPCDLPPSPTRSLKQQLQWRYGCDPSQSACCVPLPSDSLLTTTYGIAGLTPLTTATCDVLPGCRAEGHCYPT